MQCHAAAAAAAEKHGGVTPRAGAQFTCPTLACRVIDRSAQQSQREIALQVTACCWRTGSSARLLPAPTHCARGCAARVAKIGGNAALFPVGLGDARCGSLRCNRGPPTPAPRGRVDVRCEKATWRRAMQHPCWPAKGRRACRCPLYRSQRDRPTSCGRGERLSRPGILLLTKMRMSGSHHSTSHTRHGHASDVATASLSQKHRCKGACKGVE